MAKMRIIEYNRKKSKKKRESEADLLQLATSGA